VGEAEGGVRAAEGGAEDEAEDDEEGGVGGAGGRVKVDGRVMEEEGRREEGERESRRVALIMMVPGYEAGEDTEVGVGKAFDKGLGEDLEEAEEGEGGVCVGGAPGGGICEWMGRAWGGWRGRVGIRTIPPLVRLGASRDMVELKASTSLQIFDTS